MGSDRRAFLAAFGSALAAWVLSGRAGAAGQQKPPVHTCYVPPPPGWRKGDPATERAVRQSWLDLKSAALLSPGYEKAREKMIREHEAAVQKLVAQGSLKPGVAAAVCTAYAQAHAHIARQLSTCYVALPPEFAPRHDLLQQAEMLEKMAAESRVAPATVQKAEKALRRDMAWLDSFVRNERPGGLETVSPTRDEADAAAFLARLLSTP